MQPGWYAHFQEPGAVAYFDGTSWGTARDGFSLSYEIQESITTLPPGHPGPSAPFEALAIPRSRVRRPGSSWFWGVGAGALFILGGIIRGFSDVAGCGSPHQRNYTAEMLDHLNAADGIATAYAAQCRAGSDMDVGAHHHRRPGRAGQRHHYGRHPLRTLTHDHGHGTNGSSPDRGPGTAEGQGPVVTGRVRVETRGTVAPPVNNDPWELRQKACLRRAWHVVPHTWLS